MKPERFERLKVEIQQIKKDQERLLKRLNNIELLLAEADLHTSTHEKAEERPPSAHEQTHEQPSAPEMAELPPQTGPSPKEPSSPQMPLDSQDGEFQKQFPHSEPGTAGQSSQSLSPSEKVSSPKMSPDGTRDRESQKQSHQSALEPQGHPTPVGHPFTEQLPTPETPPVSALDGESSPHIPPAAAAAVTDGESSAAAAQPPQKGVKKQSLEQVIGGTWLNRIGVVAVLFGLAFFLKYSFDHGWIGPLGRVILGMLAGLVLLGVGEKLRERYPGYAQSLLGGGSLALFFSVYAAYSFYGFLSPPFAFIFLVLVMTNTVFMAVRYNSLPIGILGIIGGYTTPFFIGGLNTPLGLLFSYLIILTFGVLGVSVYKRWTTFKYLSFAFNQIIFMIVWVEDLIFGFSEVGTMLWFVVVLYLTYVGITAVYHLRERQKSSLWDVGLAIVNPSMLLIWGLHLLGMTAAAEYKGLFVFLLAIGYLYLGRLSYRRIPTDKLGHYTFYSIAFVLVNIAIPLQFSGSVGILFSFLTISTLLLLSLAIYQKSDIFHYISAYLSLLFNYLIFLIVWESMATPPIWTMFSYIVILFAMYVLLVTVYRMWQKRASSGWDIGFIIVNAVFFTQASWVLLDWTFLEPYTGWWTVLLAGIYVGLGVTGRRFLPDDKAQLNTLFGVAAVLVAIALLQQFNEHIAALGWFVEAGVLIFLAKRDHQLYLVVIGLTLLSFGLAITLFEIVFLGFEETFLWNWPTFLWLSSLLALAGCAKWLGEVPRLSSRGAFVTTLRAIFLVSIFVGISLENHHYFSFTTLTGSISPEQLTLSALWLIYALVLFGVGMWRRVPYMRYVAIGLLAIVIGKAFLIDLASLDAIFKIVLFILLGLCLLIISFIYQKKKDVFKVEK